MTARHIIFIATAAFCVGASAAPASTSTTRDTAPISAADLSIQTKYQATASDISAIQGIYALPDGRRLKVWTDNSKLFAALGSRSFEIRPVARDTFVSRDGSTKLSFNPDAAEQSVSVSEK
jgi:hypothetical protein